MVNVFVKNVFVRLPSHGMIFSQFVCLSYIFSFFEVLPKCEKRSIVTISSCRITETFQGSVPSRVSLREVLIREDNLSHPFLRNNKRRSTLGAGEK